MKCSLIHFSINLCGKYCGICNVFVLYSSLWMFVVGCILSLALNGVTLNLGYVELTKKSPTLTRNYRMGFVHWPGTYYVFRFYSEIVCQLTWQFSAMQSSCLNYYLLQIVHEYTICCNITTSFFFRHGRYTNILI